MKKYTIKNNSMKQTKYKYYIVTLNDNSKYQVKTNYPVTIDYFGLLAYHYVNKQHGLHITRSDVQTIKGIVK